MNNKNNLLNTYIKYPFSGSFSQKAALDHFDVIEKNCAEDINFLILGTFKSHKEKPLQNIKNFHGNFCFAITESNIILCQKNIDEELYQSISIENIINTYLVSDILFGNLNIETSEGSFSIDITKKYSEDIYNDILKILDNKKFHSNNKISDNLQDTNRIVSIDFETANSSRASVCSIGYVVEENNKIIAEDEILVNPNTYFSDFNIKIHGINEDMVKNAPSWDIAWSTVEKYITPNTLVIGHNIKSFDLICIREECKRYNMELPQFCDKMNSQIQDTLPLAREMLYLENYKLNTIAKSYNIGFKHHNALEDAQVCLKIFKELTKGFLDTYFLLLKRNFLDDLKGYDSYQIDWAIKYRDVHPSFENTALYLSKNNYDWTYSDNTINVFGEKYNMKFTFENIRDNIIEVTNNKTKKTLKPYRAGSLEKIEKDLRKRIKGLDY